MRPCSVFDTIRVDRETHLVAVGVRVERFTQPALALHLPLVEMRHAEHDRRLPGLGNNFTQLLLAGLLPLQHGGTRREPGTIALKHARSLHLEVEAVVFEVLAVELSTEAQLVVWNEERRTKPFLVSLGSCRDATVVSRRLRVAEADRLPVVIPTLQLVQDLHFDFATKRPH